MILKGFALCNGNKIEKDDEKILIKFDEGKNIECTFDGDMLLKASSK